MKYLLGVSLGRTVVGPILLVNPWPKWTFGCGNWPEHLSKSCLNNTHDSQADR